MITAFCGFPAHRSSLYARGPELQYLRTSVNRARADHVGNTKLRMTAELMLSVQKPSRAVDHPSHGPRRLIALALDFHQLTADIRCLLHPPAGDFES